MTEAGNGIGGRSTATYGPSSAFGCNKPPVRQVVTSTSVDDGRGGVSTTTYSYCDGRTDPAEGAFLGYGQVQATLPRLSGESAGPVTTTVYSQELRSLGPTHPRATGRRSRPRAAGDADLLPPAVRSVPAPAGPRERGPDDGLRAWRGSDQDDLGHLHLRHYANVTQQLARGEVTAAGAEIPGDELRTDMTYWPPDTARYLVSRPHTRQVSEQQGQSWTLLKSSETTYTGSDLTSVKTYVLPGSTSVERTMQYDSAGNLTYVRSELGAETTIVPTADGLHPYTVTNPEGTVTTSWDPLCDAPERTEDPNGAVTTTYDALCRPKRTDGPAAGAFTERFYESLGNPSAQHVRIEGPSSASAGGNDYAEDYFDGLGRTYRSVRRGPPSDGDIVTERSYNARGAVSAATAPFYEGGTPETTVPSYDSFDRVVSIRPPDGNETTTSYDLWKVTTTDPRGKASTVKWTTKSRVEQTTVKGEAVTTTHGFDMLGRRLTLQDHRLNSWAWTYDSLDRTLTQQDPDAGPGSVTYDDVNRTETRTDAQGQTVTLAYDNLGRLYRKTSTAGTVTLSYGDQPRPGYTNWGRLTKVVAPGTTQEIDYDAAGNVERLRRTIDSAGFDGVVVKEYDVAGRLRSLTYPDGDAIGPMEYDAAGRISAIPGILTSVSWDAAGRPLVQMNGNGTVTTRTYVPLRGVLDTLVTTSPVAGTVQSLDYNYEDDLPLVSDVTGTFPGQSWRYEYDDGYRLTGSLNLTNPSDSQTFDYDSLGRLTFNSRLGLYEYQDRVPRPHAPLKVAGAPYAYHPNGNLQNGGGRSPSWDAESRLTAVGTTTFTYDGFGERLTKASPAGTSLYPFGDDYEVTNGVITRYVSVEGLGVIAKRVGIGGSLRTYWLHSDRLGSIQAITTDGLEPGKPAGSLDFRRTYRPYGETLSESGSHTESRGWIDQRNDGETGLTYLHARYFDPKLGVFLSPDPIGVEGGMNAYGYGFGDPVNSVDRSGLTPADGPNLPWWGWWAARKLWGLIFGGDSQPTTCNPFTNPCDDTVAGRRHPQPHGTSPQPTEWVRGKPIDPYADDPFVSDPPVDPPVGPAVQPPVEPPGRPPRRGPSVFNLPPTGPQLAQDLYIQTQLDLAWEDSTPYTNPHEEGGWIYMDPFTRSIRVRRTEWPGGRATISLRNPPILRGYVLVGDFHTHPNSNVIGVEKWFFDPRTGVDLEIANGHGVPGLVRTFLHVQGNGGPGMFHYGPRRRRSFAGLPGYPFGE